MTKRLWNFTLYPQSDSPHHHQPVFFVTPKKMATAAVAPAAAVATPAPFAPFQQPPTALVAPLQQTFVAAAPSTTYTSYTTMEENLYRPENAEFVPAGRPLRGGMTPLYDMTQVRTFEAYPLFQTAAVIQARGVGSELISEGAASNAAGSKAFKTTPPSALKKRALCC